MEHVWYMWDVVPYLYALTPLPAPAGKIATVPCCTRTHMCTIRFAENTVQYEYSYSTVLVGRRTQVVQYQGRTSTVALQYSTVPSLEGTVGRTSTRSTWSHVRVQSVSH